MDFLQNLVMPHGKFLGIDWHAWKVVGWLGNMVFSSRFVVQWWATERSKQVVVPAVFWWLSIIGSLTLLSYAAFYQHDSVFIFAYSFSWIPYIRNLMIHHRHTKAIQVCVACETKCPPKSNYCLNCGADLNADAAGSTTKP